MKLFSRLLLLLLAAVMLNQPAQAQPRRVALLIGNANYAVGQLRNPANDVRVMDDALRALGFQTQVVLNANQNTMKRAVRDFGVRAQGADLAFLYYSGHGTQANGENYLIPVQASIDKEGDYDVEAVSANAVLRQIASARPKAAVVVLDACRDNPMAAMAKTGTKGLGRMDAPTGTLIAFATAPNTTASDEGHYARVLGAQLRKPGVELLDAFRNTTAEVLKLTGGRQEPRVSEVSITERIYLAGTLVASIQPEPMVPGLDLGDLQQQSAQQAEAERRERAALARMQADYDKVMGFTGPASLMVQAWERFVGAWAEGQAGGDRGRAIARSAGQQLALARTAASSPVASGTAAATASGRYVVKAGDTLPRIALQLGVSGRDLAAWNNLADPNGIEAGQVLVVRPTEVAADGDAVDWSRPSLAPVTGRFDGSSIKGLQFGGRLGDPVTAATDGRVMYAGSGIRGYGNLVIIKHPNGRYLTAYAHNDAILVKENDTVRAGQLIARMGKSDADRVMLLFEIRDQGKPVDPAPFLGL